jgi:hypothetical protein
MDDKYKIIIGIFALMSMAFAIFKILAQKNKKISKMASDYFEWVGFFVFIGSGMLTYKIIKMFNIVDRFSYQLYECPGFFLCFIEHIPFVGIQISTILKNPIPCIIILAIFFSILLPIILIYAYGFEIDYKRNEKKKSK